MKKGDKLLKARGLCAKCGKRPRTTYRSQCLECIGAYNRQYFKKNWRRYHLRHEYGITENDYETLFTQQGGVCAICKLPPDGQMLAVDHDHNTGQVRALLCNNCNNGLGRFQDDPTLLRRAAEYLENR